MARPRFKSGHRKSRFALIPVEVLKSQACASLPPSALKVLIALAAQHSGYRNGDLSIARPILREFGLRSQRQIYDAVERLEERGLIVKTRQGGRNRASLYAVTWFGIDECQGKHDCRPSAVPTNDWKKWKPEN